MDLHPNMACRLQITKTIGYYSPYTYRPKLEALITEYPYSKMWILDAIHTMDNRQEEAQLTPSTGG
jgi:hypothetical protein